MVEEQSTMNRACGFAAALRMKNDEKYIIRSGSIKLGGGCRIVCNAWAGAIFSASYCRKIINAYTGKLDQADRLV